MYSCTCNFKAWVQAQNEVAILALLDHPNVVKYYECFAEQGTKVKIVMELCEVHTVFMHCRPHAPAFLHCPHFLSAFASAKR